MVHHSLPKTKILMITGTARQDVIIGSIRLGSEGCLVKPLDRTLIEAKVRKMFHIPLGPEHKAQLASGPKRRPVWRGGLGSKRSGEADGSAALCARSSAAFDAHAIKSRTMARVTPAVVSIVPTIHRRRRVSRLAIAV